MARDSQPSQSAGMPWGRVALLLIIVALVFFVGRSRQVGDKPNDSPESGGPVAVEDQPPVPATGAANAASSGGTVLQVPEMTIRDLQGDVAYRGTVDLTATLLRIEAGTTLQFPNDGNVFQNRERRLPRQPTGYYREWVHPTPGLAGPGPQRIVTGERGEIYYTPDHYRTFRRLDADHSHSH